jgi:hypothetical protein
MDKKKEDIIYGNNNEIIIKNIIEKYFNIDDLKKTKSNDIFDFISNNIYFEVKSRRCTKNKYNDTMIGYNKILYLKKNNINQAYFIFMFEDGNYFYKYIEDDKDCNIRIGGRWDRGITEKKQYYYIPTNKLIILN